MDLLNLDYLLKAGSVKNSLDIFENEDYTPVLGEYVETGILPNDELSRKFQKILEKEGFKVEEIAAYFQYSNGSEMIQSFKNGVDKETIESGIRKSLYNKLDAYGYSSSSIDKIWEEAKDIHNKGGTLRELFSEVRNSFSGKICEVVQKSVRDLYRLDRIEDTVKNLDSLLEHPLKFPKGVDDIVVYRAVRSQTLLKRLDVHNEEDAIGKVLPGRGFCSTSLREDNTFTNYKDEAGNTLYDALIEITLDKGTKGFYGPGVSTYGLQEDELLIKGGPLLINGIERKDGKLFVKATTFENVLEKNTLLEF